MFLLTAGAAVARPARWERLETSRFVVWSDAGDDAARQLLSELESFRAQFLAFTELKPAVPQRISVVFFASDEEFEPYKPRYHGRTVHNVAGWFNGSDIQGQIALSVRDSKRIIYHEFVHAMYRELGWDVPVWFNEGSAELFSTFQMKHGVAYFGREVPEHVDLLRHYRLMPLPELFSVTTDSADYNEDTRQGLFYAESWAFVHFLACNRDPAWRTRMNTFLALLAVGRPPDEATFRQAFGLGTADVLNRLDDYIYGGAYLISKSRVDQSAIERGIKTRPATTGEVGIELAALDASIHRDGAGKLKLLNDADRYPKSARVQEALAMVAEAEGNNSEVRDRLARAAALHTDNVQTYWVLAQIFERDWLTAGISPYKRIGDDLTQQFLGLLEPVLTADPNAVDAWDELARVEAFAPKPDLGAVHRIEKAMTRWPNDPQVPQIRVLVAYAYERLGQPKIARQLAQAVINSHQTAASTRSLAQNLLHDVLAAK